MNMGDKYLKVYFYEKKFKFQRKLGIFNTWSISYSISLQPNIKQNYWKKTCDGPKNKFKMVTEFFQNILKFLMACLARY
jgi:hypothetical protein